MKSFFIGLPHGRGYRPQLHNRWLLALFVSGGALAGVVIAQNCRSAVERAFFDAVPKEAAVAPLAAAPLQDAAAAPIAAESLLSVPAEQGELSLRDAISLAEESRAALREVKDYTAVFTKTERINGRLRKQVMEMKLREQPFSVYLRYRSKKEAGRQAIFVEGRADDCLVVKDVGLRAALGTLQLNLHNPLVTCENRYPVTELGISRVVDTALTSWEREEKLPGIRAVVTISASSPLDEADCCRLVVTHQNRRPELEFHKACLDFDKQTKLPIHVERYGWPHEAGEEPPLVEEYSYSNVKTNVGLTDADFDPQRYGF